MSEGLGTGAGGDEKMGKVMGINSNGGRREQLGKTKQNKLILEKTVHDQELFV